LEAKQGQQPGCAVMVDDTIFASSSVIGGYVDLVLEATGAGKITRKKTGRWILAEIYLVFLFREIVVGIFLGCIYPHRKMMV
jgi:hypothetical protein